MRFSRLSSLFVFSVMCLTLLNAAFAAPKIEHWQTKDGLRVYFVAAPELPMLDLELVFDAGSSRDADKSGVAGLTVALLNKGAAGMNADQIAEAFESVGAQYGASSSLDRTSLSLRTITMAEEQEKALDTWLKVISKPDFPEKDFQRSIKQSLIGLEAKKQHPSAIAREAYYKHLYGDHPYGVPASGSETTLKAMQIADLKAYYKKYIVRNNALLAIVGAVNRQQAEQIAEQVAAVLPAGEKVKPIAEVKPLAKAETIHIEFPSKQSHIYMGQPGDKRGDKDYFTLYLGNHVLGGSGFTSRLMKEVRVKRGLSYSVYSYFTPLRELGPFTLGLQTKNSSVDEALSVARAELIKFRDGGPTKEELEQSKKNITGGFPLRTASNGDIVSYVAMIAFYNLPLTYLDDFADTVNSISREAVMDAYKRRIDPDKMLTVIVGKKEKQVRQADIKDSKKDGAKEEIKASTAK